MKMSAGLLILRVCIAAVLSLLAPMRSIAAEPDQQAKAFAPSAGKAAIYVYRNRGSLGPKRWPVRIDGKRFGDIAKGEFYWVEVDPGEHEVWVGVDGGSGPHAQVTLVPISAQIGQTYFVRVFVGYARDKHEAVNAATGKAELLACCKLVATERNASPLFR